MPYPKEKLTLGDISVAAMFFGMILYVIFMIALVATLSISSCTPHVLPNAIEKSDQ